MASDPRKRQKKLERRAAKRQEKKHQLVRQQASGLGGQLTAAAQCPILHAWITDEVWTEGMGQVLLSRQLPGGNIAVAVFLIDRYCLGVKDAFAQILGRFTYDSKFVQGLRSRFTCQDVPPEKARKLVEDAVAYAHELGFHPHADHDKAMVLFGDIDAAACTETFEFGKDGKPLFIAGPHDTPQRCRQILTTLTNSRGPGNFDYLIPFDDPTKLLPK